MGGSRVRTSLAFLLGQFSTVEDADQQAEELRADGIPAYVMAIDFERGPRRFRVYAGGYANEREAQPLADMLRSAGQAVELVERRGDLP